MVTCTWTLPGASGSAAAATGTVAVFADLQELTAVAACSSVRQWRPPGVQPLSMDEDDGSGDVEPAGVARVGT
jgi:hypothetical protein